MPYISKENRSIVDSSIQEMNSVLALNGSKKGDLNYTIFNLVVGYLHNKGIKYDTLSDVNGVLSDVQAEFYRRVSVPYEISKMKSSGDLECLKSIPVIQHFLEENNIDKIHS